MMVPLRRLRRWAPLMCSVVSLATPIAGVNAQSEFFTEGNRRYQAGDFQGALEHYLRVTEAGYGSATLDYNIGNTYFKLGDLGHAILHYERALRLSPHDADVQANLELARSLIADEITPLTEFWPFRVVSWWVHLLPTTWLSIVVAVGYLVAMVGLVLLILRRGSPLADWSGRVATAAGIVVLVFGVNLAAVEFQIGVDEEAIIMAEEVPVNSAPADDSSLELFAIHTGTKVRIDRRADEWVEIVLEDGRVGWVPASVLEVI